MPVDFSRVDTSTAMGASVRSDATASRTWAPAARNVFVITGAALAASSDASWRPSPEDALARLGDGSWGGFVAGTGDGDRYMFFVEGAGSRGWKRGPNARELSLLR